MEDCATELMKLPENDLKNLEDAGLLKKDAEAATEIAKLQKKHDVCCYGAQ